MRLFTNLLFKVTLSSMIATSPSIMANNATKDAGDGWTTGKRNVLTYFSSSVIKEFIHPTLLLSARTSTTNANAGIRNAVVAAASGVSEGREGAAAGGMAIGASAFKAAKAAEVRMVVSEAAAIYGNMNLEKDGLDSKAFEYAWRGYYNLLKKGLIRKKTVLSICDFSQPSNNKRMYVIDVKRKKLLYQTYVAHGQNSGEAYANSFSNEPDSYKSSLGFYLTSKTYVGRNGLSLRIEGIDSGYNDMAGKRNIVLHGSSYVSDRYLQQFGTLGTSQGCPALPSTISPRIIRTVKNGSCLFIYHPTQDYLDNSIVIND